MIKAKRLLVKIKTNTHYHWFVNMSKVVRKAGSVIIRFRTALPLRFCARSNWGTFLKD
jgi:hypothetical protein